MGFRNFLTVTKTIIVRMAICNSLIMLNFISIIIFQKLYGIYKIRNPDPIATLFAELQLKPQRPQQMLLVGCGTEHRIGFKLAGIFVAGAYKFELVRSGF